MKKQIYSLRWWSAAALLVCAMMGIATLPGCGGGDAAPVPTPPNPVSTAEPTPVTLNMEKVAGFTHSGGAGAAEISAYDSLSQRLFVVNGAQGSVDVLSMVNTGSSASPTLTLSLVGSLTTAQFAPNMGGVNSVAIRDGVVALAVEAATKTNAGLVAFVRASDLRVLGTVTVGALPDMLVFTPNGRFLLVANEGEPSSYGQADSVDPEGSISVIEVAGLAPTANRVQTTVSTAGFTAFNTQLAALRTQGVRIFGPGASVAQDLEPEYITVSADSSKAWVSLQENNAMALLDIASKSIVSVQALGYKDHNTAGNGLDASNEDGGSNTNSGTPTIKIANYPIKSLYMPDGIAAFKIGTRTFLASANEGDAREYTGINAGGREDPRVRDYCTSGFDSSVFGALTTTMGFDSNLGRLRITTFPGDTRTGKNSSGQCNELVAFGGRSLSIWDTDNFGLVWDSGDQFEQRTAALHPTPTFNASNDNNSIDDRSPAKGPEPESVVIATFGTKTFAFVGLERVGGVMVYDVSNPASPIYITYLNTRNAATGDRGPEGLLLIPAAQSPTGRPLLVVAHETSGTTAVFQLSLQY
jgi:hypothetical protein